MFAVTTTLRENPALTSRAKQLGTFLSIPFLARKNRGIGKIIAAGDLEGIIVVGNNRLSYVYPGGELFFHPGMAKMRINEILRGKTDQMIKAMNLLPGDSVIDCTLGLASDAIVASFVSGRGKITGLEHSPVISLIVKEGLASYDGDIKPHVKQAMKKIEVICTDYNDYLKSRPDNAADIIYFDPMFRVPEYKSTGISGIRPLADNRPVSASALREALRVARKRVVLKEAKGSGEFSRLGISIISGGKNAPVAYGIIEKTDGKT